MKFASSPRLTFVCVALLCGCSGGSMPEGDPQKPQDDLRGPDNPSDELMCRPSVPYKPRLARLTHRQYANTLAALLGESVDVAAVLSPDPAPFRFDNDTGSLRVSQPLARDYRRVAEDVGSRLAKDGARTKQLTGCATEDAGCATRFIETFGAKAFRRPLAKEEKAAFAKLYEAGCR